MAQMVQHADFVEQAQRVVEGQEIDQRSQTQAPRPLRHRGQEHGRGWGQAEGRDVVLSKVIGVKACLVGVFQHLQALFKDVAGRCLIPFDPVKDAKLQG